MPDVPRDHTARLDAYLAGDVDEPEPTDDFADIADMVEDVQRTNPRPTTPVRRLRPFASRPILAGYGNAADPEQGPPANLWCTFSLFDVDSLSSLERAQFHAARAEAILTSLEPDHVMSAIIAAAEVHALLSSAWAAIDRCGNS